MCDLFQANPWKPLLCTNCHQNRSGHSKLIEEKGELPASTSSMHLYEEIMAQYFTINPTTEIDAFQSASFIESTSTTENVEFDVEGDEDSFSDEEQPIAEKSPPIEFIPNQSMINTQGIVLIGPDLKPKETPKKMKKIHLLRKTKSNADECLKKNDMNENTPSKLRWFKVKKSQGQTEETKKSQISPPIALTPPAQPARIRVLPEINKLTINEALNIARRQHCSSKPTNSFKLIRSPAAFSSPHYSSSIASTTSSSTHSSNEYETNPTESTYLVATAPMENLVSNISSDQIIRSTIERLTSDLGLIIDEYKHQLPVAQFQTFKSLLHQHQTSKLFSTEALSFLLLQLIEECSSHPNASTVEHFLIAHHSTLPILVTTNASVGTMKTEEQTIEQIIQDLAHPIFPSSDLSTLENLATRSLATQIFQYSSANFDQPVSMQRLKVLDLFWTQIPSLRNVQINEENERILFLLYYFMRRMI